MRFKLSRMVGVSLLEMLITLLLSSLVLLLVWRIYGGAMVTGMQQMQWLQLTSAKLRMATILQQEVTAAGFLGCPRWDHQLPVAQMQQRWSLTVRDQVKVYQAQANGWRPALPTELVGKVSTGSDVLQIVHGQSAVNHLLVQHRPTELQVTTDPAFKVGDIVAIADCTRAAIAQVAQVYGGRIRLTAPLATTFSPPTTVVQLQRQYFFVNRQGEFAWQAFDHAAQVLLPEIHQWRIHLLELTPEGLRERPADQVHDWDNVIGVFATLWHAGDQQPWQISLALRNSAAAS